MGCSERCRPYKVRPIMAAVAATLGSNPEAWCHLYCIRKACRSLIKPATNAPGQFWDGNGGRDAPIRRFGQARQAREIGLFGGLIKPFAANRLADLRFERESMTTDDPAYHR